MNFTDVFSEILAFIYLFIYLFYFLIFSFFKSCLFILIFWFKAFQTLNNQICLGTFLES